MLNYNQFLNEDIKVDEKINFFDLLYYKSKWGNNEYYGLVISPLNPKTKRFYYITKNFDTTHNINNLYTGYGSSEYSIVKIENEKQQLAYDELKEAYKKGEKYLNIKEGDYVKLKGLTSILNGKIAKVINYNNGIKPDENGQPVSDTNGGTNPYSYGVILPRIASNMNKLGGKIKTNSGLNISINNIESFIDPTDSKVAELEKKLKKIIDLTPEVGDYILCKNYLPQTSRQVSAKDLIAKVCYVDGYRVVAKLSEPKVLKEGVSFHLINLTFNNISKILPKDNSRVERYIEQENEYLASIPNVGDYIKLKGRVSNFDIPENETIIAQVVTFQKNNNYGVEIISHIGVKLSRPTARFVLFTLAGAIKTPVGVFINFVNIEEIIKDKKDKRILDYLEDEKTYMERIPSTGDFVIIDILNNKIGQVIGYTPGYTDTQRIRLLEYHNPNEQQFLQRFRKDDSGNYYADFKIGLVLKALPDNPFVKAVVNKIIQPIVISEKLKKILPKYLHKLYSDISYLDVGGGIDEITFATTKKVIDLPEAERWTKGRQSTKVGRLIQRLCGNDILQKDVERMVNDYKASYKIEILGEFPFQVVEGEEIRYWYLESRYQKPGGTLNNSCMRYEHTQPRLQIYVDNPEVCKLIIMKNGEGKLKGRALLWTLEDGRKYMDRVYTVDQHDENMFWKYAEHNKYLKHPDRQNYKLSVKVKPGSSNLPYLDSLKSYDAQKGTLRNY